MIRKTENRTGTSVILWLQARFPALANPKPRGPRMNVSLRPDLEKFVNEKLQSGQYRSPDEVLSVLKARDEAEHRLETLLQEAEDSGPATEMTPQDWTDIEQEGLRRLNSRKTA